MTNSLKRAIFGTIYIVVMWTGSYYSNESRFILFVSLTLISIFEILKIRSGKSKVLHILYVCTIMSQYLIELKILLFVFILTWIFDTFAYLIGIKIRKT